MSARSVTAAEIRAAKMLDKGFRDTLQVIANQLTGGQV